ncbi:DMT family transporter [Rubellimicrobium roseum]|nr:DMT family transporter [Rubellimicrobium roseum]
MTRLHANLLLLVAALAWGSGNVAQKTVLDHLDPLSAVGLRCLIAGLLVLPLALREAALRPADGEARSLLQLSGLFALALVLQQAAFLDTTVTNAGFLVNTCAVMTPLVAWASLRQRPEPPVMLAAGITLAGVLCLSGGLSATLGPGDGTALLSALAYAAWMVALGRHAGRFGRPFTTGAAQFLATAAVALALGTTQGGPSWADTMQAGPELLYLGIVSTGLAFMLQIAAQRVASASQAAVICSGEAVVGAALAIWLLGEVPARHTILGAALIMVAIALAVRPATAPVAARAPGRLRPARGWRRPLTLGTPPQRP